MVFDCSQFVLSLLKMRNRLKAQQRSNRNTAARTISVHTLNTCGILFNIHDTVRSKRRSQNLNGRKMLTTTH